MAGMVLPVWRRFHTLPRPLRRLRSEFWPARLRWQYERSAARYALRDDHISAEQFEAMLCPMEIGRFEGFRFITSPAV